MKLNRYNNLAEAKADLFQRGYRFIFELGEEGLYCLTNGKLYQPGDMSLIEYHRFEEGSTPSNSVILVVVECHDGVKGTISSTYSTYYDLPLLEFIDKVRIKSRNNSSAAS